MVTDSSGADAQLLRDLFIAQFFNIMQPEYPGGHRRQSCDSGFKLLAQFPVHQFIASFKIPGFDIPELLLQQFPSFFFFLLIDTSVTDRPYQITHQARMDIQEYLVLPEIDEEILHKVLCRYFVFEDGKRIGKEPLPCIAIQSIKGVKIECLQCL